jgi:hypothetical protein
MADGEQSPALATPITGRSGKRGIPPSWSRTPRCFGIPITIALKTPSTRSISTGWHGWYEGWRKGLQTWLARSRSPRPVKAVSMRPYEPFTARGNGKRDASSTARRTPAPYRRITG